MIIKKSLAFLILLLLVLIIIDGCFSTPLFFSGLVVDKYYRPESVTIGTGVVTSNGNSGIVTTTDIEPQKFLLMVRTKAGKVLTIECGAELYYSKKEGQSIDCYFSQGFFTHWHWDVHAKK